VLANSELPNEYYLRWMLVGLAAVEREVKWMPLFKDEDARLALLWLKARAFWVPFGVDQDESASCSAAVRG
jgi:hypothetical protein